MALFTSKRESVLALVITCCLIAIWGDNAAVRGHEGPDAIAEWLVSPQRFVDGKLKALMGPDFHAHGDPTVQSFSWGDALRFDGADDYLSIGEKSELNRRMNGTKFTVSVWASVDRVQPQGGLIGVVQRAGEGQKGWLVGYTETGFTFTLATLDQDDGNGRFSTLTGKTAIASGKFYHVVATYDGQQAKLYVNGQLEDVDDSLSGPIIYGSGTSMTLGALRDRDEFYGHQGSIRSAALYDLVASDEWVTGEFQHNQDLLRAFEPFDSKAELAWVVSPYLHYVTQTGINIACESNVVAKCDVRYGIDDRLPNVATADGEGTLHHVTLKNLEPQTGHYYQVELTDSRGKKIVSPLLSFQTANLEDAPFSFGVMGDTQLNPKVSKVLSDMMWAQRPNFFMIAGDLTDNGTNKSHWTDHFFPGIQPLASRVALFPVLGNHEQNAKHYYDYMTLPAPEYFYTFTYGNAQFFMLDSNKEVGPESEQFEWLEKELAASTATWKFACYHHPSYSSDEDDYGNLWRGPGQFGDQRLRPLSGLYDKYGLDIVWNGHIHSYERTWPLAANKAVERQGTIYIVTGGGGGGLETAGPIKPYFQNSVKHGHHYCLVSINGRILEFKAFDMDGRLFDTLTIEKQIPQR